MHTTSTGHTPARVTPARASLGLAILLLLTVLSYLDRAVINLMVEPIKTDLGIDDFQFSLLSGFAFAVFYALFSLPIGWLADRHSRRLIIYAGVTLWSLATAGGGLALTFVHLMIARVLVGAGEATLHPAGYAMLGDMFSPRRLTLAVGILAAGTSLGSAIALSAGSAIYGWADAAGGLWGLRPWQTTLVVIGLPGLAVAPLVFIIPRAADRPAPNLAAASGDAPQRGYAAWLRRHKVYLGAVFVMMGLQAGTLTAAAGWAPAFLTRHFGMTTHEIGAWLSVAMGLAGIIGFVAGGWIVDWLHGSRIKDAHLRYALLAVPTSNLAAVAAFSLAPSGYAAIALMALMFLLAPINGPVIAHLQMSTPPQYRATTLALFLMTFQLISGALGMSSAALLSTLVFDGPADIGPAVALTCAIGGTLATILLIVAIPAGRRAVAEQAAASPPPAV